jgi:hypothetical protein
MQEGTDDDEGVILAYRQTRGGACMRYFSFFFRDHLPLTASRRDNLGAPGWFVSNHTLQMSE